MVFTLKIYQCDITPNLFNDDIRLLACFTIEITTYATLILELLTMTNNSDCQSWPPYKSYLLSTRAPACQKPLNTSNKLRITTDRTHGSVQTTDTNLLISCPNNF